MQRRIIVQHRRQLMQLRVAKALRLDRLHRGQDVVAIVAGTAVPLLHVTELICQRQPPGVLHMTAVDDLGQRTHALPGFVFEPN